MKDKLHFRTFFNIQIKWRKIRKWFNQLTYPCCMSATEMSLWEQWQICKSLKCIYLFFLCMTCTALPSFYLTFSHFPMTSLLKLLTGYKIYSELELSYCCGNVFFSSANTKCCSFSCALLLTQWTLSPSTFN